MTAADLHAIATGVTIALGLNAIAIIIGTIAGNWMAICDALNGGSIDR